MVQRGFGSIRKLPSGMHQCRYIGPDGRRHTAPRTYDRWADADNWLNKERRYWDGLEADGKLSEWRTPEQRHLDDLGTLNALSTAPTLQEYSERYMRRPELSPSTLKRNKSLLKVHILPSLGSVRLPDITKTMIRGWWQSLDPEIKRTNDLAYQLLRGMLNIAVEEEILTENPCQVKGAGGASKAKGPDTLTPAEVIDIANSASPRLAMAIHIMAWCDLRNGEVFELRRKDIEPDCSVIHVRRAVTKGDNGYVIGPTKTEAGVRDMPVPEPLQALLKKHLRDYAQIGPDGLLFYNQRTGQNVNETEVRDAFVRAREKAGTPLKPDGKPYTPYDLRAFALTQAGIAGATLRELQARAGHTTAAMVMRYQRVDTDHHAKVTARIGEQFEAASQVQ